MLAIAKIREDLVEVRYYYTRKKVLDEAMESVGTNTILGKVKKAIQKVGNVAVNTVDVATGKENNNLLLIILIVIIWIYLFFKKGEGNNG